jgi:hypothetical protein
LSRTIIQHDIPIEHSHEGLDEEVTVLDPRHPLYERRFQVAQRVIRTGRRGQYLLVFYKDGVLLRLPVSAVELPIEQHTATKVTFETVTELLATARRHGLCP